jgi:hypothetical protein
MRAAPKFQTEGDPVSDLSPELVRTLDEHIEWVKQATELAITEGAPGIKRALDALEPDQREGMLFVMVSERAGSVQTLREHLRDQIARQQFDRLDGDRPTLH